MILLNLSTPPVLSQEGALEEAQNENERLKEKISGLKQQYGPIGKQGRVILQQLGEQLGRRIGGMFGYIIKAGEVLEKRRKPKGKIHDILPWSLNFGVTRSLAVRSTLS